MIIVDHTHPKVLAKLEENPGLGVMQAINCVRMEKQIEAHSRRKSIFGHMDRRTGSRVLP